MCFASFTNQRWVIVVDHSSKFKGLYSLVNSSLMDWKPKMEQQLLEIEKKESKKLKKLLKVTRVDEPEASLESEQAKPEQLK